MLAKLKLPFHEPLKKIEYNKEFWDKKSKYPYCWGPKYKGIVPWIGFLGYQIRYDNIIRVRRLSINKELKKQVKETNNIIKIIRLAKKRNNLNSILLNKYQHTSL